MREQGIELLNSLHDDLQIDKAQAACAYIQAGKVIYDLNSKVYRLRELSREPLSSEKLRFSNPRKELAAGILEQEVKYTVQLSPEGDLQLAGTVKGKRKTFNPSMVIDSDEKINRHLSKETPSGENNLTALL